MPAYRSSAEAEIRDAVVSRIRERRPNARIIHEINVSTYGPNRIDLIAVDHAEIIAIEIKSAKDKLDRLPAQIAAMRGAAHHVVAALHEKFLVPSTWNEGRVTAPPEARGAEVWAYPEQEAGRCHGCGKWQPIPLLIETALPGAALDILWRDELYDLCGALRISAGRRATMTDMSRQLRWLCSGRELTRGICAALRARRCVEADPEVAAEMEAA